MCKLRVWWLYYIGTSHTSRSPYYEKFCTTQVTILWLYIVQNVQVTSMVTVLYRHKSHIAITILWKILYYTGHYTVTLHSTKCPIFKFVSTHYLIFFLFFKIFLIYYTLLFLIIFRFKFYLYQFFFNKFQ